MGLKPGGKKIVGYELGEDYVHISYYTSGDSKVETVSCVPGEEVYGIEAILCKRCGSNQWLFGKEALRTAQMKEGIPVEHIFRLAMEKEPLLIEGEKYDPAALLALFLKKTLSLIPGGIGQIAALMFTGRQMNQDFIEVLNTALMPLGLKTGKICFQSYEDSCYQYLLHEPEELWHYGSLLAFQEGDRLHLYRMSVNHRSVPAAVSVQYKSTDFTGNDSEFLKILQSVCEGQLLSSVYLVGEKLAENSFGETLAYLCHGRRVFQGSNLFSKGAVLGMMERIRRSAAGKKYVFLGEDKLKVNIGMYLDKRDGKGYFALIDAGVNWYEAQKEAELYLQKGNRLELTLTPLDGRKGKTAEITLDGLPVGPARILLSLKMLSKGELEITAKDLGFGEFRKATERVFREKIVL